MEKANELAQARHCPAMRGARTVLMILCVSVVATAAAVGWDMYEWQDKQVYAIRTFQKALGGLGMGAIASPIWQFMNYDARILPVDDSITWPIPGGYSYGPDRTGTVSYFEEISENQWIRRRP